MTGQTPLQTTLVIEAGHVDRHYWRDVWRYRELMYFLAWRDVIVRYKQTVIGATWAVLRPIFTMVVFSIIFGNLAKMPSGGVPYPIMVFAALLPWQFFASALNDTSNSLVSNGHLVSKIFFPRIIIPVSAIVVSAVDFCASLLVMAGLMIWFRYAPPVQIVFLPLFFALVCAIAAGMGMVFASVNVKYRDFRMIVPFGIQFGLYVSPVGFNSTVVPEHWKLLYSLNPMVGVIDGFRWCLLGGEHKMALLSMTTSLIVAVVFLYLGIRYFRATEKGFADVI
jgi:lipopolysaccharide transport system permease protein